MKLLITGGAGFIGTNFVYYWLERHPDDQIIVLDALTYAGNRANLRQAEAASNVEFVHGNILDQPLVCDLIHKIFKENENLVKTYPDCPSSQDIHPRNLISHVTDRPGHDRRYAIDATKIGTALGCFPETPFGEGIAKTIAWYCGAPGVRTVKKKRKLF